MKKVARTAWLILLALAFPSVSFAGFSGSLSYIYQDHKLEDLGSGTQSKDNYFLQRYNLNYNRMIPLIQGALGHVEGKVGLGWDIMNKDINGESIKIDKFKNDYYFNVLITPLKVPVYFEVVSERSDWPELRPDDYTSAADKLNDALNGNTVYWHNSVRFKYVVPRYFYLLFPSYTGNGNGGGNGNGNGMSFSGNGNGMSFGGNGGNGNGNGALFGNGNGNGNGGFFGNGNGNGNGGNGNGNGGGFVLKQRLGPLVPYAYLFNWENYKGEGNVTGANYNYNSYSLNLGFLKFWINAGYEDRKNGAGENQRASVSIGQMMYDGRLLWTRVSNWVSASSYFAYTRDMANEVKVRDQYQGNFIFQTNRKDWQSGLASSVTYDQTPGMDRLNVNLPYSFYGSTNPASAFSGNLNYEFDRYMPADKLAQTVNVNNISHAYSYQFIKNGWNIVSRHDLIALLDNVKDNDFTAFNYRLDLYKNADANVVYNQETGYEASFLKSLEGQDKFYQVHSVRYRITGPLLSNLGFELADQLAYYDNGQLPVISNRNYISEQRRLEHDFEPTGRSIRNSVAMALNYRPSASLMLSVSGGDDEIYYTDNSKTESRRGLTGAFLYTALENKLSMSGDLSYKTTDRLNGVSDESHLGSMRIDYTPTYNFKSTTAFGVSREEIKNVASRQAANNMTQTSWVKSASEELTYSVFIDDFGMRKIMDVRAYASGQQFNNLAAFNNTFYWQTGFQNSSNQESTKTLYTLEGSLSFYPHRFVTLSGYYRENTYKEEGYKARNDQVFSLNAAVNFPRLSISGSYTESKARIGNPQNESRYYLNLTKTF